MGGLSGIGRDLNDPRSFDRDGLLGRGNDSAPASRVLMTRIEAMIKLSLHRVSKLYGGIEVLAPLDLHVAKGEFVTLLGPSGSGKSTLLRIIAGMTLPTGGQVFIDGQNATDLPARVRGLGMV